MGARVVNDENRPLALGDILYIHDHVTRISRAP
jgi:hypothetical protein